MSQHDAVSTTIDGCKYEMNYLPPMESHELFMDVVKMVGPTLGPLFDLLFAGKAKSSDLKTMLDQEIGPDFFSRATTSLFDALNKDVSRRVIEGLRKVSRADGTSLDSQFDVHFHGRLDSMYKWVFWGMRVQWGKCFGALGSVIDLQGAKFQTPTEQSPSPNTLQPTG